MLFTRSRFAIAGRHVYTTPGSRRQASITGFTDGGNLTSSAAVAPLMKHYVAYSVPEGGHNCAPAHMGKRELLSDFLPPFTAGFEAGAQAVMVSCAGTGLPFNP